MGRIPEETIAQVIDRTDIVEVVSSFVPLKRAGRNFKANCPFHHEKTPSFVVNPDKQIFHCFGCGVGGNVITFLMKQDHMEFPEALRALAEKAHVEIPQSANESSPNTQLRQQIIQVNEYAVEYFQEYLLSSKEAAAKSAREYLQKRKVALETAKQFRLGLAPDKWDGLLNFLRSKNVPLSLIERAGLIVARENKEGYYDRFRNRIVFPIFDTRRRPTAFGARALDEQSGAKYINSPETPIYTKGEHLYGLDLARDAISKEDCVIIVEGYMDCLIPFQAGVHNIIASLGTALTVAQIRLIRRYTKNVIMLFDTDEAGVAAMMRSCDTLIEEGLRVKVASLDEGEDPDSFICANGVDAFKERIKSAQEFFDYKFRYLKNVHDSPSVEEGVRIAHEMLETINKFSDELIRSSYLTQLSRQLMIKETALQAEMVKLKNKAGQPKNRLPAETSHPAPVQPQRPVEKAFLALLMQDEQLISNARDAVDPADFLDEHFREIIEKIYDLYEQNTSVTPNALIQNFEDQTTQQIISALASEEQKVAGDKEKAFRDCVTRLKNDRMKRQRQHLLKQIRDAEHEGNQMLLEQLRNEFNQLIRGIDHRTFIGEKK